MPRSPFYLVGDQKKSEVRLGSTNQVVAWLYRNSGASTYRFRLRNYPHNTSKIYQDVPAALAAIEREVL